MKTGVRLRQSYHRLQLSDCDPVRAVLGSFVSVSEVAVVLSEKLGCVEGENGFEFFGDRHVLLYLFGGILNVESLFLMLM